MKPIAQDSTPQSADIASSTADKELDPIGPSGANGTPKPDANSDARRKRLVEYVMDNSQSPTKSIPNDGDRSNPTADQQPDNRARLVNFNRARALKFGIAACAAVAVGIGPILRLNATDSAQAVVNSGVITIRAPIDGMLSLADDTVLGAGTAVDQIVLSIHNDQADRSSLDSIRRDWLRTKAQRDGLAGRIKMAEEERNRLLKEESVHKAARLEQIRFRKEQIMAQIFAATARETAANASFDRVAWLADRGLATIAQLELKRQDKEVALRAITQLANQLAEVQVEYDAETNGIRLTDDHNTSSSMKLRADQLTFEINNWTRDLDNQDALIAGLEADLDREKERYAKAASRRVSSPAGGRIWEIIAASGEFVRQGQPILRILDCSGTVVSTTVSEATYNTLSIGDPAIFRSSSELTEYKGRIVKMHGLAAPQGKLAIEQASLRHEPFRVTVLPDNINENNQCIVGKTGIVRFQPQHRPWRLAKLTHWLTFWTGAI